MGLIIKDLAEIAEVPDRGRSLYIYLLDYGWPDGEYERIFSNQWSKLCERASETNAIVIKSQRGVHFANSVLNWHSLDGREIENILPAILLTKSPPSYFFHGTEPGQDDTMNSLPSHGNPSEAMDDMALLPLGRFCNSPDGFSCLIEGIFADLERGKELRNFGACSIDVLRAEEPSWNRFPLGKRLGRALLLQPNFAGIGLNLKTLFSPNSTQEN